MRNCFLADWSNSMRGLLSFLAAAFFLFTGNAQASVLFYNGPVITSSGGGSGGADISEVQSSLGMETQGFSCSIVADTRVADEFVVTETWDIERIFLIAFQTGASGGSTITDVRLQILDGSPADGGNVIWGNLTTNRVQSTYGLGSYRVDEATPMNTDRPLMGIDCAASLRLDPGTYWLEFQMSGDSGLTGPWQPPVTISGSTTTGNALSYDTTWGPCLDTGTMTQQGIPFQIYGEIVSGTSLSFDDLPVGAPVESQYPGVTFSSDWRVLNSMGTNDYYPHSVPQAVYTHSEINSIEWDQPVNELLFYINNSVLSNEVWTYTVYDNASNVVGTYTNDVSVLNQQVSFTGPGIQRLEVTGSGNLWPTRHTIDDITYISSEYLPCPSGAEFSQGIDVTNPSPIAYPSDLDSGVLAAERYTLPGPDGITSVRWWGFFSGLPSTDFEIHIAPDSGGEPGITETIHSVSATAVDTGYEITSRTLYQFDADLASMEDRLDGWITIASIADMNLFSWVNTTSGNARAMQYNGGSWSTLGTNMSFCLVTDPLPTETPTAMPTNTPTHTPTNTPTNNPTQPPTNTPTVSPTPQFTATPTNTPTDNPTNTHTPSPTMVPDTPTFTPLPTETPDCGVLGCTVEMPVDYFTAGTLCWCHVEVCNTTDRTLTNVPVFVVLDVYGQILFAPGFNEFDHYLMNLNPGGTLIEVIPEFTWPADVGSAEGIIWYAAMTNPEITDLYGKLGVFTFGWGD